MLCFLSVGWQTLLALQHRCGSQNNMLQRTAFLIFRLVDVVFDRTPVLFRTRSPSGAQCTTNRPKNKTTHKPEHMTLLLLYDLYNGYSIGGSCSRGRSRAAAVGSATLPKTLCAVRVGRAVFRRLCPSAVLLVLLLVFVLFVCLRVGRALLLLLLLVLFVFLVVVFLRVGGALLALLFVVFVLLFLASFLFFLVCALSALWFFLWCAVRLSGPSFVFFLSGSFSFFCRFPLFCPALCSLLLCSLLCSVLRSSRGTAPFHSSR